MQPSLYLDRDTFVHRLDPRTKIFLLLGTFVLAFVFADPLYLLVLLAVVLLFGYLSQSLVNLRRIWFILVAIAILSIVLWSIVGGGETPFFLFVEREAFVYGIGIALRLDVAIMAAVIFLSTTRNEEVAAGLVRLGTPYRFAFAVSRTLRLVPAMIATGHSVGQAQRSRGLDLDSGNVISRYRKRLPLLAPVLRRYGTLERRPLSGHGLQGFRGRPWSHLPLARRDGPEGHPRHSGVRAAPGRVHRPAGDGIRGPLGSSFSGAGAERPRLFRRVDQVALVVGWAVDEALESRRLLLY